MYTADDLRNWADCMDNPALGKPDGVNPAAAPELLEACKRMIERFDILTTEEFSRGGEKPERDLMIAAIAKAEGRE